MCEYPLLRRLVATEPVVYTILTRFEIMLIRSAKVKTMRFGGIRKPEPPTE
jgi:hypothetical protein